MGLLFNYSGKIRKLSKEAIPSQIVDEWEQTLKGERARILSNVFAQIPSEPAFIAKIADPASAAYEDYVNPEHPKSITAILKHKMKLRTAYNDWKSALEAALSEGGTFETNVTAKKEKWRNVRYALSAIGEKSLMGLGAITKAVGVMTGDKKITAYMGTDDSLTGTPTNVFKLEFARYVKPILVAKGVFASAYAFLADDANDTATRNSIISSVNSDFATLLNVFKRDDLTFSTLSLTLSYDESTDTINVSAVAETV